MIDKIRSAAALLGRLGGLARARKLSKKRMSEIGRMGAEVTNSRRYLDPKHGYKSWSDCKKK